VTAQQHGAMLGREWSVHGNRPVSPVVLSRPAENSSSVWARTAATSADRNGALQRTDIGSCLATRPDRLRICRRRHVVNRRGIVHGRRVEEWEGEPEGHKDTGARWGRGKDQEGPGNGANDGQTTKQGTHDDLEGWSDGLVRDGLPQPPHKGVNRPRLQCRSASQVPDLPHRREVSRSRLLQPLRTKPRRDTPHGRPRHRQAEMPAPRSESDYCCD
jgi:hypothetical protein